MVGRWPAPDLVPREEQDLTQLDLGRAAMLCRRARDASRRRSLGTSRYQGGVSDSSALAAARRIVPAPPIRARRQGATPSISVSSEKLRNVLITTISPSTRTLSREGATATVRTRSAATRTSSPSSRVPAECLAQYEVSLCRPAGSPRGYRREHEGPDHADYQDRSSQCLEALGNVIHKPGERLSRLPGSDHSEDHVRLLRSLLRMPSPS